MKKRLDVPIFDIDQNLTTKDIPVVLQKWNEIAEFISIDWRKKLEEWYWWVNGEQESSFIYGRDTGKDWEETFPNYIKGVLEELAFWPSFPVFKNTIILANPFGKNTSRGHGINNIIRGTKMLILWTLSPHELEEMHESITSCGWNTKASLIESLDDYLWQQIYAPIHNLDFMKKYKIDYNMPYNDKKAMVMEHIVLHVSAIYKKYFAKSHSGINIWFSDDDEYNIKAVNTWWLEHREWLHMQNIHFTTYHTSKTETIKRIITDLSRMNVFN